PSRRAGKELDHSGVAEVTWEEPARERQCGDRGEPQGESIAPGSYVLQAGEHADEQEDAEVKGCAVELEERALGARRPGDRESGEKGEGGEGSAGEDSPADEGLARCEPQHYKPGDRPPNGDRERVAGHEVVGAPVVGEAE